MYGYAHGLTCILAHMCHLHTHTHSHTVLYHPSPGWVSIAFGQDTSHSDDDITQYMWHDPQQYMASSLSQITSVSVHLICFHWSDLLPLVQFASIGPICFCWSNLLLSELTTHGPHHQLTFIKLGWNIHMPDGLGPICGPYHCREKM